MKTKHKERLKTYSESDIYSLILITFFYVIIFIALWNGDFNDSESITNKILVIHTIVYIAICIIITVRHFYIIIMQKRALEHGEKVEGKVKSIKSHKTLVHSRNGDYTSLEWDLIISYRYNNKLCEAKFGRYPRLDDPGEYISAGDKCYVYIYKGKPYLQNLYKKTKTESGLKIEEIYEGKYDDTPLNKLLKYPISEVSMLDRKNKYEAVDERHAFSSVRSKSYLIVEPLRFYNNGRGYILLIEVYIASLIAYNEMDFTLRITLGRYLRKYEAKDILLDEELLKKDVERIVKSNIRGSTIQARVKSVEMALLIDYELESADDKKENDEQLQQLKADIEAGKYINVKFEELAYCSAKEIIKLTKRELNRAYLEREMFSQIKSLEFMMIPSVIFLYPAIKVIFIDVFIISDEAYCEKDFELNEKVQDYAAKLFKEFTQYEDSVLKENISQLVTTAIHNIDSSVEVLDIVVEIMKF